MIVDRAELPLQVPEPAGGQICLTQQEQTMVTISTLVALGTEPQLKVHIITGFTVGLTMEKIVSALIHCIPYIGFPRVLNALTLVKEVMAE